MSKAYIAGAGSSRPEGQAENEIIASLNRNSFRRAGVLSVNVAGNPGSGKSTLIVQTIARLLPEWQAGVIAANSMFNPDIDRYDAVAAQIAKLQISLGQTLLPKDIQAGLSQLDLSPLGAVFIENIGLPHPASDLGEGIRVAVFSAAAADKAAKYPQTVQWADAVVLTKLDMAPLAGFDLNSFRQDVKRINPNVKLFELSAIKGLGLDEWSAWVRAQIRPKVKQSHGASAPRGLNRL